ncbi:MAG: cupin domain-containing protein [Deltaproteobacteria bacterium]|nr:cupin domain-containing protein [Deltaproteobacteria bacterium]
MANTGNIFETHDQRETDETFIPLLQRAGFRLEQIVSNGQASAPGFWYDQDRDEWVMLVRGEAVLELDQERVELKAGDYLLIPAHVRHRVASCSQDAVWLALHMNK